MMLYNYSSYKNFKLTTTKTLHGKRQMKGSTILTHVPKHMSFKINK